MKNSKVGNLALACLIAGSLTTNTATSAGVKRIPLPVKRENFARTDAVVSPGDLQSLRDSFNRLAWDEFDFSVRGRADPNVALGTFDRGIVLSQSALGAKADTLQDILAEAHVQIPVELLHPAVNELVTTETEGVNSLEQHTMLWGQGRYRGQRYLFAKPYIKATLAYYGAGLQPVDYRGKPIETRQSIQGWVSGNLGHDWDLSSWSRPTTRQQFTHTTRLDGHWAESVDVAAVSERRFEGFDGKHQLIPGIQLNGVLAGVETATYKAVELPLADSDLALLVIMPSFEQFSSVESLLGPEFLSGLLTQLQPGERTWILPVVDFEWRTAHGNSGQQSSEQAADFSGVNARGYLYQSGINSGAAIQLSADGARFESLAIATLTATGPEPSDLYGGGSGSYGSVRTQASFCQDVPHWRTDLADVRPFFYFLRDKRTDMILALGKVSQINGPQASPDYVTNPCNFTIQAAP